jgi:hypothetical protein
MWFSGLHDSGRLDKGEPISLRGTSGARCIIFCEKDPPHGGHTRGGAYCTGTVPS